MISILQTCLPLHSVCFVWPPSSFFIPLKTDWRQNVANIFTLILKSSLSSCISNIAWQFIQKHCKNCECCPVSQLIVSEQRLSLIQALNCFVSIVISVANVTSPYDCSIREHPKCHIITANQMSQLSQVSCLLITLIKCLKGHKSLGSLCDVKIKSHSKPSTPPPPIRASCTTFLGTSRTTF